MNAFFKTAFLIVSICLVLILGGIYLKMGNSKFVILTNAEGGIKAINSQTGAVYFYGGYQGWFVLDENGQRKFVKNPF